MKFNYKRKWILEDGDEKEYVLNNNGKWIPIYYQSYQWNSSGIFTVT